MITKADTAAARSAPKRASQGSAGSAGSAGSGAPDRRTSSLAEAGGVVRRDEIIGQIRPPFHGLGPHYPDFMIKLFTIRTS